MTYAQKQNKPPFNWFEFLQNAKDDNIDDEGWWEASSCAICWVTCACGNQSSDIKRTLDGSPVDIELGDLGLAFSTCIDTRNTEAALLILTEIEKRAAKLLADV